MTAMTQQDNFGSLSDGSILTLRRWLPGPASRIWRYLTDSDLRSRWLASGDMPLAPGATFELVWRNDSLSHGGDPRPEGFPEEQRMTSHVVAIDPEKLLTFAWGDGTVTFELTEKDDRVLLTVTHRGLKDANARVMIAAGWHIHVDILTDLVMERQAESFWSGWQRLRGEYSARLPN